MRIILTHTNPFKSDCSSIWQYSQCSIVDSVQSTSSIQTTITMENNRLPSVPCTHSQHQQSNVVSILCAILPPVCILPSPSAQVTFLLLSLTTELTKHASYQQTPSSPLPLFAVACFFCFAIASSYAFSTPLSLSVDNLSIYHPSRSCLNEDHLRFPPPA